jgi:hypothetical protein
MLIAEAAVRSGERMGAHEPESQPVRPGPNVPLPKKESLQRSSSRPGSGNGHPSFKNAGLRCCCCTFFPGLAFTRGRPRNHHQPGDTLCNHVVVHLCPTLVSRFPSLISLQAEWQQRFARSPVRWCPTVNRGSRVHCGEPQAAGGEGCPRGTHCVGALPLRGTTRPRRQLLASVALSSAPGRARTKCHGRLVPPFRPRPWCLQRRRISAAFRTRPKGASHAIWLQNRRNTHAMMPPLERDFDTAPGRSFAARHRMCPRRKKRACGGHRAIPGLAMATPALRMPGSLRLSFPKGLSFPKARPRYPGQLDPTPYTSW